MADLVIREKDIVNLGRKTMKEVYEFLNDEYFLKNFDDIILQQKSLEINLIDYYLRMKHKFATIDSHEEVEYIKYIKEKEDIRTNKINYYKCLKEIEDKIEDESLDIKMIYEVLEKLKLEFELEEDLFVKKKAFIYYYSIYYFYDYYLKE